VDSGCGAPQVAGNINAVEAIVRSGHLVPYPVVSRLMMCLVNHGCFAPVKVITRPIVCLTPIFPRASPLVTLETGQRVVDVVPLTILLLPGRIPAASQGSMNNFLLYGN